MSRTSMFFALVPVLVLASCGGGGGGGGSTPPPPPPDTTAPDTTITSAPPAATASSTVTLVFSANETATFEGRMDNGAYAAVTSPWVINNVADGSHQFDVRARDNAGNTDASPASATWVTDTTPPDTQITAAPASNVAVSVATFTMSSTETGGTLEASIDGAGFMVVTSPYSVSTGIDGTRTIQFRARDAVGNVDASPVSASWLRDGTPPQSKLTFPAQHFATDAATITVRGTASDPHGVTALSVNGVAVQTADSFAHWSAVIPVPVGDTPVTITATDTPGNTADVNAATMVNRGPFMNTPRGIAYDALRDRIIHVDQSTGNVIAYRHGDGIGQMLSAGPSPGTTPGSGLEEMVIDAAHDRALILNSIDDAVIAVDLATGARSIVSAGTGHNVPTSLWGAFFMTLDSTAQNAYVTVGLTASVVRVNLATGARTVVSSNTLGTGDSLVNPMGVAYDDVTNAAAPRLLVIIHNPFGDAGILAIDCATGNRTHFSFPDTGSGKPFDAPLALRMDTAGQRVLVSDLLWSDLVAVSLANGNRTTINGFSNGTGPFASYGFGIAFDPATRKLFAPLMSGGIAELDVVSQARRAIASWQIGFADNVGPQALFIEQTSGTPTSLVYVHLNGALYRLDLASSNRSIISWAGHFGSGPSLQNPVDMVLDRRPSSNGRAALVLTGGATPQLISVNLDTGDRALIANVTTGVVDNGPTRMGLDVAGNRIILGNNESASTDVDEIYAIDLANGNLSAISDASDTGPAFLVPGALRLVPADQPTRALVADIYQPRILSVDLATGTRTLFDDGASGSGVAYSMVSSLFLDSAGARLLVTNAGYPSHLFEMPLAGGTRRLISGANPSNLAIRGSGPPVFYSTGMDVDLGNGVAYVASSNNGSIIAIDLGSGDRAVIAH